MSATLVVALVLYFLPINVVFLGFSDLCKYSIWFVLGMISCRCFYNKKSEVIKNILKKKFVTIPYCCVAVAFTFFITRFVHSYRILELLVGIIMILACVVFATLMKNLKCVEWVSSHNFTFYIFSWLFQAVVMVACNHFQFDWMVTFWIMFATGVIGPLCIIIIFDHIQLRNKKWLRVLIGAR